MSKINASKFLFSFDYKERDLKFILNSVYKCYLKIMISNVLVNNNENDIRDIFISDEYLDNYALKKELDIVEFKFDKEIQTETGRVDIRVLNMVKTMKGDFNPYYFIECKRIKGDKTYNDYYIDNGISRFIDEKYHTYQEANAMMGFVVKQIDIKTNSNYFNDLSHQNFIEDYEYTYVSSHLTKSNKKIILYHLMLDFSSKINSVLN